MTSSDYRGNIFVYLTGILSDHLRVDHGLVDVLVGKQFCLFPHGARIHWLGTRLSPASQKAASYLLGTSCGFVNISRIVSGHIVTWSRPVWMVLQPGHVQYASF